jgi:hypothetical protein
VHDFLNVSETHHSRPIAAEAISELGFNLPYSHRSFPVRQPSCEKIPTQHPRPVLLSLRMAVQREGFVQDFEADAVCTFPPRTLRCMERKGQAADGQKIAQNRPHSLPFLG